MLNNAWIYIAVMAGVTYLIRVLPLTLIRKEIKNQTVRSFLFYVPYVTLAVMTFPAIIQATDSMWAGLAALIAGIALAWFGGSLFQVAVAACAVVFVLELFL
ncbi:AzlD domain-containing protein [Butyricicoccus sp.]|uniref:AzlD domain-containing protein n=1 Tax=Butyricicoccus sp. TaxID=2049021 RepID=UPI003AAEA691